MNQENNPLGPGDVASNESTGHIKINIEYVFVHVL